jgi:phage antirepressor YoqD-like protein
VREPDDIHIPTPRTAADLVPSTEVVMVPFDGGHIPAALLDGEPHVVLRPVAEALGLTWPQQYARLRADASARLGTVVARLPDDEAPRHAVVSDLETFVVWLAGLRSSWLGGSARDEIVTWKRQAGRALREHFFGPREQLDEIVVAERYLDALRQKRALEARLADDAPLVAQARTYNEADGLSTMRSFARDVQRWAEREHGCQIRQQEVFDILGELGMIIRATPGEHNQATRWAERHGYAFNKNTVYDRGDGRNGTAKYARLTPRGEGYAWRKIYEAINARGTLRLLSACEELT